MTVRGYGDEANPIGCMLQGHPEAKELSVFDSYIVEEEENQILKRMLTDTVFIMNFVFNVQVHINVERSDLLISENGSQIHEKLAQSPANVHALKPKIVDSIQDRDIRQDYIIGGNGTQKGAAVIYQEVRRRGLKAVVARIPKTIYNDNPGLTEEELKSYQQDSLI
ncbi:phosphofructokinase 7 [Artemisia annua]|uniref:Phosphofructokinase 7 n=1 Tax=Artemisia annua TaxID=35608 RepID=A0A2U1P1V7_ARTAN|nr:phosphofructokinase 7 [Artemisia annua]